MSQDQEQKSAHAEATKRYRERMRDDPEYQRKKKAQDKRYREENRVYKREYRVAHYQANKAATNAQNEAWTKANPERTREISRASYKKHKDKVAIRKSAKRSEEQKAHDDLTIAKMVDPNAPVPALQQVLADQYEKRTTAQSEKMKIYLRLYRLRIKERSLAEAERIPEPK